MGGAVVVVAAGGAVTVFVTVCVMVTVFVPPQPASAPSARPASPIESSRVNRPVYCRRSGRTADYGAWTLRSAASLSFTSAVARNGTPLSANIVYRTATDSMTPSNVGITPATLPHETLTFGGR